MSKRAPFAIYRDETRELVSCVTKGKIGENHAWSNKAGEEMLTGGRDLQLKPKELQCVDLLFLVDDGPSHPYPNAYFGRYRCTKVGGDGSDLRLSKAEGTGGAAIFTRMDRSNFGIRWEGSRGGFGRRDGGVTELRDPQRAPRLIVSSQPSPPQRGGQETAHASAEDKRPAHPAAEVRRSS